jgi:hypothetical protein
MEELGPIQKLDYIFNQFVSTDDQPGFTWRMIQDGITDNKIAIGNSQLIEILHKLEKDLYIRKVQGDLRWRGIDHINTTYWKLTLEGEVFKIFGGYTQQLIDAKSASDNQSERDHMARIYETRLLWATRFAGIGACALVLWEICKYMIFPAFQYYCHCEFIWQK